MRMGINLSHIITMVVDQEFFYLLGLINQCQHKDYDLFGQNILSKINFLSGLDKISSPVFLYDKASLLLN